MEQLVLFTLGTGAVCTSGNVT